MRVTKLYYFLFLFFIVLHVIAVVTFCNYDLHVISTIRSKLYVTKLLFNQAPSTDVAMVDQDPNDLIKSLVIVSALSSNHFQESMDLIGSLHHFLPNNTIYIYNIGLKKKEIDFLNGLKNVQVVDYNFTAYPDFRDNKEALGLGCYAWKVLIINELSKKHKVIAWFDSSVRINKPLTDNGCIQTLNDFPMSACSRHGRPLIEFATDSMLDYLKIKREDKMKNLYGFEACCMMYKVTKKLLPLLDKMKDCATHRECICGGRVNNPGVCIPLLLIKPPPIGVKYINGCHRYDQAALTLIASQLYGINTTNQIVTPNCSGTFSIVRTNSNKYKQYILKKQ